MDMRVFWAVLGALCAFAVLGAIVRSCTTAVALQQFSQSMHDISVQEARRSRLYKQREQQRQQAVQAQLRRQDQLKRAAAAALIRSRTLSETQQCVEHFVIDVRGNVFSQPLHDGKPIPCDDRLADFPLR